MPVGQPTTRSSRPRVHAARGAGGGVCTSRSLIRLGQISTQMQTRVVAVSPSLLLSPSVAVLKGGEGTNVSCFEIDYPLSARATTFSQLRLASANVDNALGGATLVRRGCRES